MRNPAAEAPPEAHVGTAPAGDLVPAGAPLARVQAGRLRRIIRAAADLRGIHMRDLMSRDRHAPIAEARQLGMLACRELTGASLPRIGRAFGRDHTTVLHGIRAAHSRPGAAAEVAEVARAAGIPTHPIAAAADSGDRRTA